MWTARVRTAAHALTEPFMFSKLILTERYGPPDTVVIEGAIDDLRPTFELSSGILIWDDAGRMRFSGVPPQHPKIKVERRGDDTASVNYESDTVHLWDRFCWPTPTVSWGGQTTAYDIQSAVHETRIIGYITRNAGAPAYTSGGFNREIPHIRIPTTLGRGTIGQTSARFQNLGALVAELAEAASLRVTIQQTYEGATPFLDVVIDTVPDLSAWARFGDAESGSLGFLAPDWRYALGIGSSVILSAAGGELENRLLTMLHNGSRETLQGRHVEFFVDQRDTEDVGEISERLTIAMAEQEPSVEAEAPIIAGNFEFGSGADAIPLGAKVGVLLDGELVVDRIRQLTTTVGVTSGQTTITVEPVFGSPEAGLTIDQKFLRRAARRLINLERSL